MGKTKIEWCNAVWNPIAGCNDVSEGCRHCYARTMARRLEAMGSKKYAGLTILQGSHTVWTGKISFDMKALLEPLHTKKPTVYFANSMSDPFHKNVTDEMREQIFAVAAMCPQHRFLFLTKRPREMHLYWLKDPSNRRGRQLKWIYAMPTVLAAYQKVKNLDFDLGIIAQNVWLGVSAENQAAANKRIPYLMKTPAVRRFVSAEPLLGPINFEAIPPVNSQVIDWVIVGGESGPDARPMHPEWARSIRDQCVAAKIPFFFKQWGAWARWEPKHPAKKVVYMSGDGSIHSTMLEASVTGEPMVCVGKKKAGNILDGRQWLEVPEAS